MWEFTRMAVTITAERGKGWSCWLARYRWSWHTAGMLSSSAGQLWRRQRASSSAEPGWNPRGVFLAKKDSKASWMRADTDRGLRSRTQKQTKRKWVKWGKECRLRALRADSRSSTDNRGVGARPGVLLQLPSACPLPTTLSHSLLSIILRLEGPMPR